ncbi:DIP1984 family protein [Microbacterium maritypicum]
MRLAEALTARADLQRRIEQLRARITANARYQEGEEPAEDASALLVEAEEALAELRDLIRCINATNARLDLGADGTMTDALAARDVLRLQHSLLADAAAAASGGGVPGFRQMRSELRQLTALPVGSLRARADETARELRELDNRIQQANWTNDLEGESGSR